MLGSFHRWLRPGGSVWVFDLVTSPLPTVQAVMWRHYGAYLTALKGEPYRDDVFAYIEREDTPRPLGYQPELMTRVGFRDPEVLHKHLCFAAFGAVKA